MILTRSASAAELAKDFAGAQGLVHLTNSGSPSWHGFASAIAGVLKVTGQAVGVSAVYAHEGGFSDQGRSTCPIRGSIYRA
jgi:dTDP-4-dehydrorhamnose reductase